MASRGLTGFGSGSMETDPMFQNYSVLRPTPRAGPSPLEQAVNQPIQRIYDPQAHLTEMMGLQTDLDKDEKWLRLIGTGLQLQNPRFNASKYIKDYRDQKVARATAKWNMMKTADQVLVGQAALKSMQDSGIPEGDKSAWRDWWKTTGLYDVDLRDKLFKSWSDVQPDPKLALDALKSVRDMRKTARADVKALIQDPLKRIRLIEDSANKVRITARKPTNAEVEWVRQNYNLDAFAADTDAQSQGIRDIALINSYQRMIDPATVREGDVALQRAANSVLGRLDIWIDQIVEGKFLNADQRAEMQRLADEFYGHTLRNNLKQITGGRDVFTSRYTGSTGSKILTEADIDSDFSSVAPKSAITRWEREYKKHQSKMKASSKERPIVIFDIEEEAYYLPGTLLQLGDRTLVAE